MTSFLFGEGETLSICGATRCGEQVSMLRVEDASVAAGTMPRAIYRWIEAGRLHFAESDTGLVLVCARSLASFSGGSCR